MRSQHTEGIDVISRSGKSNWKFTSQTNIDWSWFGKVRVYFWQCLHRSLVTRVSPNLRQYVSSHVAHFGKKTTTHGHLVSVLTYSLLKDCIKNCHSFCYVFVLKWKKKTKNEMVQVFWFLIEVRLAKRTQKDCYKKVEHIKSHNCFTRFWCHFELGRYLIHCIRYLINLR